MVIIPPFRDKETASWLGAGLPRGILSSVLAYTGFWILNYGVAVGDPNFSCLSSIYSFFWNGLLVFPQGLFLSSTQDLWFRCGVPTHGPASLGCYIAPVTMLIFGGLVT